MLVPLLLTLLPGPLHSFPLPGKCSARPGARIQPGGVSSRKLSLTVQVAWDMLLLASCPKLALWQLLVTVCLHFFPPEGTWKVVRPGILCPVLVNKY